MSHKPLAKLLFGRHWPKIEASVTAVDKSVDTAFGASSIVAAYVEFTYEPPDGEREYGEIEVNPDSYLFGAEVGEKFIIHYNPKQPTDYYV